MFTQIDKNTLFNDYYSQWIKVYKEGAIRNVTMKKYRTALEWLKLMVPSLRISEMDRIVYQKILNSYAKEHERPIYNSTANDRLAKRCQEAGVPVISIHGLRHTHASILLFSGVNIASVARRLGHASMTTTQKTYLHVIRELDNQDLDIIMRAIANLQ